MTTLEISTVAFRTKHGSLVRVEYSLISELEKAARERVKRKHTMHDQFLDSLSDRDLGILINASNGALENRQP